MAGSALTQPILVRPAMAQQRAATTPAPGVPVIRNPAPGTVTGVLTTLTDALALAYSTNPTLLAARAQLRSVDENVPQALAGWRPTIVLGGTVGAAAAQATEPVAALGGGSSTTDISRPTASATATITQPVYRGGRTRASTNRAENQVMAQRARLIATEEQLFSDVVNAYVGVIQSRQILQLDISNEQVLTRQLQATNDRFRVGEITRTDVAQAEAALAQARATRQTASGNVQTSEAAFQRTVGVLPPARLVEPQPLRLPTRTMDEAMQLSAANNPNVVAAQFDNAAAKDLIDVQFSALMPTVSLQGQAFQNNNSVQPRVVQQGGTFTANLSVPIYQGGAEYSAVRQARQAEQQARKAVDDARRAAIQQAIQAWETLVAARSTADSTRAAIRANEVALEGVQREALVGSRTTLDVLNAEQTLLNSRVTLVQNLASLVTASYTLAVAIGRLTARDLNLNVPLYDETAYYNAVRDKLWGTGDYATGQPGR